MDHQTPLDPKSDFSIVLYRANPEQSRVQGANYTECKLQYNLLKVRILGVPRQSETTRSTEFDTTPLRIFELF